MIQKKVRILEILPKNDKKEIMHRRFKFKINMKDLVDTLMKCACYFIRCIKSNEAKKALVF